MNAKMDISKNQWRSLVRNDNHKKFNKHVDLQMIFELGKKSKFHEKRLKKWTLEIVWTHFVVLHLKQSSEFRITL